MRRPMGPKDSAKFYMAIAFLIFAREQRRPDEMDAAADAEQWHSTGFVRCPEAAETHCFAQGTIDWAKAALLWRRAVL